jgi:hypothetical protein
MKDFDSKRLGILLLKSGLTKPQIDTIKTDFRSLNDKFFFTLFSDSFMQELDRLRKVTTKEDAIIIAKAIQSDKYKSVIESYKRTTISDMYNSGITAELLNRICIDNGFNPKGAGRAMNTLMRE